jgi:hypothetical protein
MKSLYLLLLLTLVSCASSKPGPIVQHEKITDQAQISADVAYCGTQADTIIAQQGKKGAGAKGALKGSARGAAKAAAGSAILGGNSSDRKTSAKYGAALGAAAGAASARRQKENIKRNIQAECLNKKGYKIYGWN